MMNEAVRSIMTTDLITVRPSANLYMVRQIFLNNNIHHLPVTNERQELVGLLTTYDLWKNEIAPADYPNISAGEIMTTKLAKISADDKIGTAAEIFLDNRFHALPVVDNKNRLQGIITSHDVLKYQFIKEYPKPILFQEMFSNYKIRNIA